MNVSLTPKLEAFVRRKVAEGLYGNASEVVREALRRQIEAEAASEDSATAAVAPLDELVARLRLLESRLRARGVAAMYVVGSYARREARPGSDVDLLIDPDPASRFHLLDLAAAQHACEQALGLPTDVLTRGALDVEVLASLERDAVQVF